MASRSVPSKPSSLVFDDRFLAAGCKMQFPSSLKRQRCGRSAKIAALRLTDDWATRQPSECTRSAEELAPPARDLFEHLAVK